MIHVFGKPPWTYLGERQMTERSDGATSSGLKIMLVEQLTGPKGKALLIHKQWDLAEDVGDLSKSFASQVFMASLREEIERAKEESK